MDQVTLVKNQMRARNWQELPVPVETPEKPVAFKQLEVQTPVTATQAAVNDHGKSINSFPKIDIIARQNYTPDAGCVFKPMIVGLHIITISFISFLKYGRKTN